MKTIFITGASSGLGKATAKLFQSKGWRVLASMRDPSKEQELGRLDNVKLFALDVTKPSGITDSIGTIINTEDVDVVLNNAGFGLTGPFEAYSNEQIESQIDTNLTGVLRVSRPFVKSFREKGKHALFITITSTVAIAASPLASVYSATKFALEGWSESMNYDMQQFGIRFKTVAPGGIKTSFGTSNLVLSQHPAYEPLWNKMMAGFNDGSLMYFSEPEAIAAVVYEAATDGNDQQQYAAGPDAVAVAARRKAIGAEAHRREIAGIYIL